MLNIIKRVTGRRSIVLLAAILQAPVNNANSVAMRTVDKGVMSNMDEGRQATVRSADAWSRLWMQHAGDRTRPTVDFTKDVVVAVFMGTRPTGGFAVEITGIRQEGASLVVLYKETRPAPDGVAAQVLTSPFHIVAVPREAATAVKFERVN